MDTMIQKLTKIAKKNRFLTLPVLLGVVVLVFIKNLQEMFVHIGRMTRTKKIIAAAMALVLLLGVVGPIRSMFQTMRTNAEGEYVEWDGTTTDIDSWYQDTTSDTYTIKSAEQLAGLAELVNNRGVNFYGKTIYFTFKRIDMQCNYFTPIGTEEHPFLGSFVYSGGGSCDALEVEHFYAPDSSAGIFGVTSAAPENIMYVDSVAVYPDECSGESDAIWKNGELYLPATKSDGQQGVQYQLAVRSVRIDGNTPWRGGLQYTVSTEDGSVTDGISCDASGRLTVQAAGDYVVTATAVDDVYTYSYLSAPRTLSINVHVQDRNTITVNVDKIYLEALSGSTSTLDNATLRSYITAVDPSIAAVSADANEALVVISGSSLADQTLSSVAGSYGTTQITVSSGRFASDDKTITVVSAPVIDSISLNQMSGEVDGEPNKVYIGEGIQYRYTLRSNSTDVTDSMADRLTDILEKQLVVTPQENVSQSGRLITFTPQEANYAVDSIATISVSYTNKVAGNTVTASVDVTVATSGNASSTMITTLSDEPEETEEAATSEETQAAVTQEVTEEATTESEETDAAAAPEVTEKAVESEETEAATSEETEAEVYADFGTVIRYSQDTNITPQAQNGTYGGYIIPITYTRYHKITSSTGAGYSVAVRDTDTTHTSDDILTKETEAGVFYVKNGCDFYLDLTLNPQYILAGNVVYNEETILNNISSDGYSYQIPTGIEDCAVDIQNVDCTNTAISRIAFDNSEKWCDLGTNYDEDTQTYVVEVPYHDFPEVGSVVTAVEGPNAILDFTPSVVAADAEDEAVHYVKIGIRPEAQQYDMVTYTIRMVRLKNDEAELKQVKINDETVIDLTNPDESQWVQDENGAYKAIYKGEYPLTEVTEENISFVISDEADWDGGYGVKDLHINRNLEEQKILFTVRVIAQDQNTIEVYKLVLQENDNTSNVTTPAQITVPSITDGNYSETEMWNLVNNSLRKQYEIDQETVPDGEIETIRTLAYEKVWTDLGSLLDSGWNVDIIDNQYIPAVAGFDAGANKYGTDGQYDFNVIVSNSEHTLGAILCTMKINASEYVPVDIESVEASNGEVKVTLSTIPTDTPDWSKFVGSIQINEGAVHDYVLLQQQPEYGVDENGKYVITFHRSQMPQMEYVQSVVIRVSYDDGRAVAAEPYLIDAMNQCEAPVANIAAGTYNKVIEVSLTTATAGADIYYRTGQSGEYTLYTQPLRIAESTVLEAYAVRENMSRSVLLSNEYKIEIPYGMHVGTVVNETGNSVVQVSGLESLFTEEDQKVLRDGGSVTLWLQVEETATLDDLILNNADMRRDALALLNFCNANQYEYHEIYNIKVMKKITDSTGDEVSYELHDLPNAIRVTLGLDGTASSGKQMVRIHEGQASLLTDLDSSSATYTFSTDKMSLYAFVSAGGSAGSSAGGGGSSDDDDDDDSGSTVVSNSGTSNNSGSSGSGGSSGSSAAGNGTGSGTNSANVNGGSSAGTNTGVANGSNNAVNTSNGNIGATSGVVQSSNQTLVGNAKTGDSAPIKILVVVIVISLFVMAAMLLIGRRRDK
jgi:hypothetical protein